MRSRNTALAVILCLLTMAAIVPFASAQAPSAGSSFLPVVAQTLTIPNGTTGTLTAIKITGFANKGGKLVVSGLASVTTATGTIIGSFTDQPLAATAIPIATAPNLVCPILHLDIGPISLNLLGLVVTVPNNIVLDITAVSGPGNLLGNLLCAIVHLLDRVPPPLDQIVALLQQILALL